MTHKVVFSILTVLTLFACNKQNREWDEINAFLEMHSEFNRRTLNTYRGQYYELIEELPSRKLEDLNQLDLKFESLISEIDKALATEATNLNDIRTEYNDVLNALPKIVDHRDDYLLPTFKDTQTDMNERSLHYIKHRLIIAMAYAFEYASQKNYAVDGLYSVKVDSIISRKTENGVQLTLTSKHGQALTTNRHVLVDKIAFNGHEKQVPYELKDNYAFKDIVFDSLRSGTYNMKGTLRFYHREGKFDTPFQTSFKVD